MCRSPIIEELRVFQKSDTSEDWGNSPVDSGSAGYTPADIMPLGAAMTIIRIRHFNYSRHLPFV